LPCSFPAPGGHAGRVLECKGGRRSRGAFGAGFVFCSSPARSGVRSRSVRSAEFMRGRAGMSAVARRLLHQLLRGDWRGLRGWQHVRVQYPRGRDMRQELRERCRLPWRRGLFMRSHSPCVRDADVALTALLVLQRGGTTLGWIHFAGDSIQRFLWGVSDRASGGAYFDW
jgi:hypothetical protein